eukprot:7571787-Pyramimonas_sp.AAC.1
MGELILSKRLRLSGARTQLVMGTIVLEINTYDKNWLRFSRINSPEGRGMHQWRSEHGFS